MHLLTLVAGAALLSKSVAGDYLETIETCDADLFRICGLYRSYWHTDFGVYEVNAADGCRGTSVPGMTILCVDWNNRRGHFQFSHQGFKRCFVRNPGAGDYFDGNHGCDLAECWRSWWNEVPCSWREAGGEIGATASVSELPGNETEAKPTAAPRAE